MDKIGEKIGFFAFFLTIMSVSSSPHPLLLGLCYLIHESGHLIFAKINGVGMNKLKIGSFRLSLSYDCSMVSYGKELLVCAGGIIFNLAFFLVFNFFKSKSEGISFFAFCNLSLALMNLYPISTLDGGRILKCLSMLLFNAKRAEQICRVCSFFFAFILWLCAVYLQLVFDSNVSLFFISVFLLVELCFSR
ncbi:MAG: site-2 protease family protein [Clostridia bacterium]|nr:site-2 protease family protein [Clostridia bacterium]